MTKQTVVAAGGSKPTDTFLECGYCVFDLSDTSHYVALREAVLAKLQTLVSPDVTFEHYHTFVTDDAEHKQVQFALFNAAHELGLHSQIVTENLPLFQAFFLNETDEKW